MSKLIGFPTTPSEEVICPVVSGRLEKKRAVQVNAEEDCFAEIKAKEFLVAFW
jgi:hypothetical protein